MKVLTLLPLAFVASAFIIPDPDTIESLRVQEQEHKPHPFWDNIKDPSKIWDELEEQFKKAAGHAKHRFNHKAHHIYETAVEFGNDFQTAFAGEPWMNSAKENDGEHPEPPPPPPPHHGPPCHSPHGPHGPHHPRPSNKSVYEVIAGGRHFTKFTEAINEFPDLVELLNGTTANFTVFAPTDRAFERIPRDAPKPPKEFLKSLLTYHISKEFYPAGRILVTRTVPSALEAPAIGGNPQRLSTQLGLFGITVNFYAGIVFADRFGTNGVVHALDAILLPPPKVVDILGILPSYFSTLELALYKTDLYELFNDTSLHVGGTLFAPDNFAFSLLGPGINAYLFSPPGKKYLKALLLYHAAPDITLYSDAIYKAEDSSLDIPKDFFHIELPTGLEDRPLSIDTFRFGRLVNMKINGFVIPTALDGIAADGVIHTLSVVLIPPREAAGAAEIADGTMSLEEFKARLEPFVEADDEVEYRIDGKDGIWEELK